MLVKCHVCAGTVSDSAPACPKCGAMSVALLGPAVACDECGVPFASVYVTCPDCGAPRNATRSTLGHSSERTDKPHLTQIQSPSQPAFAPSRPLATAPEELEIGGANISRQSRDSSRRPLWAQPTAFLSGLAGLGVALLLWRSIADFDAQIVSSGSVSGAVGYVGGQALMCAACLRAAFKNERLWLDGCLGIWIGFTIIATVVFAANAVLSQTYEWPAPVVVAAVLVILFGSVLYRLVLRKFQP